MQAWFCQVGQNDKPKVLARTHFPGKQYEFITSNMAESMNICLRTARKLPIVIIVVTKRMKAVEFFTNVTLRCCSDRTYHASSALEITRVRGKVQTMTIQDFPSLRSFVNTPNRTSYDVDLEPRTCSCHRWHVTWIPCTRTEGL